MDYLDEMSPNGSMDMMRMMVFHFGNVVPQGLLFTTWTVKTPGDMVGAVIVWFILAILYEGLKTLREYLIYVDMKHWKKYNHKRHCGNDNVQGHSDKTTLIMSEDHSETFNNKGFRYYSISVSMHLIQSALHVIQVGYGYLLMLVIMTFNGWLFLAVCFGAGVGYLLFAKSRHLMGNFREQNEHCH